MEITKLKPLTGHTTPETAYVVNDYPYGFRLRCKIRYWLEYTPKHGFRLCSQTTNPKLSFERWNAPKKSIYMELAVMGLDEKQHVTWTGLSRYDLKDIGEFTSVYGESFDSNQAMIAQGIRFAVDRYEKRKQLDQSKVAE